MAQDKQELHDPFLLWNLNKKKNMTIQNMKKETWSAWGPRSASVLMVYMVWEGTLGASGDPLGSWGDPRDPWGSLEYKAQKAVSTIEPERAWGPG